MFASRFWRLSWLCVVLVLPSAAAWADDDADTDADADKPEPKVPFAVQFVDEAGKPLARVQAGVTAYFGGEGETLPAVDDHDWHYFHPATSDTDGVARFTDGGQLDHLCLVARHAGRNLVAIAPLPQAPTGGAKSDVVTTIKLRPACRVSGRLVCSELAQRDRPIGWTNVYLSLGDKRALGCIADQPTSDQEFHFYLPPGKFTLWAYGAHVYDAEREVVVKDGQHELVLPNLDLPARRLALLQGEAAPELHDIADWKNGPAVSLAELKGKVVLLDFWGYWCGPCVHQMPELFELYDKYHDRGLEIIGVHVDLGKDETQPVDTPERLDERLVKIRRTVWKGRDIPYPVALVAAKPAPFGPKGLAREARCQLSADYGVTGYPTVVLIDRAGNVVERFHPQAREHRQRLEEMLKSP